MSLNRIVLVGRLTRDPEMKYTPQGIPVATFGIAVNRFTKGDDGDYEVDFFNVVAWRRSAEFASNYLSKGRLVSVDGRLQARQWVEQTTGQKRTAYEIVAENLQGLDKRQDGDNGEGHPDADHGDEPQPSSAAQAQPLPTSQGNTATATRPAAAAAAPARTAASAAVADGRAAKTARAAEAARLAAEAQRLAAEDIDESDPFADE